MVHEDDIEIAIGDMTDADTCTYIIRSECDLPGFAIKGDNTMDASQVDISLLEWREDFITEADDRVSFISGTMKDAFGADHLPPALNTLWIEKDDSDSLPGQLGQWKNITLDTTYAGEWVMTQMHHF